MNHFTVSIIMVFLTHGIFAQTSMDAGFQFLEKGEFTNAENFFGNVLKNEPDNRTAQICYGRAMGLNGKPDKANSLFNGLMKKNPNDYEVLINYYESFLWGKRYEEAEKLYANLVEDYPNDFGAVLGYANTLSNVQKYEKALAWVEKALALQPTNQNALISKKYINLGLANVLMKAQDYNGAKIKLDLISKDFPKDREVLLNLANLYLNMNEVALAKATYLTLATNQMDSIVALNGIALAEHIGERNKIALEISKKAKLKIHLVDDKNLKEKTYERYAQALIWNRKFAQAKHFIDSLANQYGDQNWIYALRATWNMYTGNMKTSLTYYNAILETDSTSFDGNLGKANALFALGKIDEASAAVHKTLSIFENQKDALKLLEEINSLYNPSLEEKVSYSFDNGNNLAYTTSTMTNLALSTKFESTLGFQYRWTENSKTTTNANMYTIWAGFAYTMLPKVKLMGMAGLNNAQFEANGYTQPFLSTKLVAEPYRLQYLEAGYQRELQNFNTELIEREIVMHHYGLNYNLGSNFGLGWYNQLMYTRQSDGNQRNLLFTSLYHTVLRKPTLKLGLNYQYLAFTEQVPTVYFSPEKYQAGEVFLEISGKVFPKSSFRINSATGLQQVEEDGTTSIFRVEVNLKHQFSKRLNGSFYGKYTNIASATATGFQFTEMGILLKWLFKNPPNFYNQNE